MKWIKWIALFSQTGSEIAELSKRLGRAPSTIMTNNRKHSSWNKDIKKLESPTFIGKHNDIVEMLMSLPTSLITLHGYLRILPPEVCQKHFIINGHPGDIISYPQLKGKDPQKKAVELKLPTSGVVLHKVIPAVDEGPIVSRETVSIEGMDEEQVIAALKSIQVNLWHNYLTGVLV